MKELAKRFHSLFSGLERAHGVYKIAAAAVEGQKLVGRATTVQQPVTDELWLGHLEGKVGIGVVPIRDDATCLFGAVDVDVYAGIDLKALVKRIADEKLPLVPCRSKSGGLHAFVFMKEPVPAVKFRAKLRELAVALGFGTAEVFPKQNEILASRGDVGQWINMPYFDAAKTLRYGFSPAGMALSAAEFLDSAEKNRVSVKELEGFSPGLASDLSDGPPCLQFLLAHGFSAGTRNDGLFNLGVYLRKAKPDTWATDLEAYNARCMKPILSSVEVQAVVKSLRRKTYAYMCSRPPICGHCNLDVCRGRLHGVGRGALSLQLTGLTKYNAIPPVWFIDVDGGGRLELATQDLQDQARFQRRCMDELNKMPPPVDRVLWQVTLQALLDKATVIEAPADASPVGQFLELLEKFLSSRVQAQAKEEILIGKPWFDGGNHWFRMSDLTAFLGRHYFTEFKVNQIASALKARGAEHRFINIKGKGVNVWIFPEIRGQDGPFDVPDMGKKEPF